MRPCLFILLIAFAILPLSAAPVYSPTWGFRLDLPEDYELTEGNGRDRFSFQGPNGTRFDIAVYSGVYQNITQMAGDINRRLGNTGEGANPQLFDYGDKAAALMELRFGNYAGWGLCVELDGGTTNESGQPGQRPLLLALSYAPSGTRGLELYHMSALDSIIPSKTEQRHPGPIMEFGFPRGEKKLTGLALTGINAMIREGDAEAAQTLIDREFALLRLYQSADNWQEAWIRFYRVIYRDSWDRVADAVFQLERFWNVEVKSNADKEMNERALAEKALAWVQGFSYERDFAGSDFVNLVSALTEGRGDCDSRAMLWALILTQANIPAAIMVSREHSHAMGLADISGAGARFEAGGTKWLVAETTANVNIGLIAQNVSDIESWLAVLFD
ncbi:MAG: hypothetical protein LBH97_02370 [Treponema sp.]|jgi:hypothetical protein|nr:hypothetical protein [Treponema sp.]